MFDLDEIKKQMRAEGYKDPTNQEALTFYYLRPGDYDGLMEMAFRYACIRAEMRDFAPNSQEFLALNQFTRSQACKLVLEEVANAQRPPEKGGFAYHVPTDEQIRQAIIIADAELSHHATAESLQKA